MASLTLNMSDFGFPDQAWARLLEQARTLAPERYPITITITHLLTELAHGSNEAAAAFLDDQMSSERDTMLVQRCKRLVVARAMVTNPGPARDRRHAGSRGSAGSRTWKPWTPRTSDSARLR